MKSRTPFVTLVALLYAGALHADAFGINFITTGTGKGTPTSGTYDGVLYSNWTSANAVTAGTVASHGSTGFTLPQSVTGTQITGWYAAQDYWGPGSTSGGIPNSIYGSTLGGNKTAGLAGYSSVIQFSNIATWLADNSFSSLNVTVYYSSYATLSDAGDPTSAMNASYANVFLGGINSGNANSFASTATLIGASTGAIQGTGPYYIQGSTVTGVTGDFVVASLLNTSTYRGGIAAIKLEGVAVPEPASCGLIGAGVLAGLAAVRRRRRTA